MEKLVKEIWFATDIKDEGLFAYSEEPKLDVRGFYDQGGEYWYSPDILKDMISVPAGEKKKFRITVEEIK
jgi:hypothetical protein